MRVRWSVRVCLLSVATLGSLAIAHKVKIGHDKSVDFSTYTTYTLAAPAMPPTSPLLYATVVDSIDGEPSLKGLQKVEKDGDLTLIPAGGIEYGNNIAAGSPIIGTFSSPPAAMNATMWTGAEEPSPSKDRWYRKERSSWNSSTERRVRSFGPAVSPKNLTSRKRISHLNSWTRRSSSS